MSLSRSLLVAALTATTLTACSKKDADEGAADTTAAATAPQPPAVPRVSSIELGRAVDSTRNIMGGVTSTFGTRDTIYLAVRTENTAAGAMLTAKWMTDGGVKVDSTVQQVAQAAAAGTSSVTEFHIMRDRPWPTGKYRVEVLLDGTSQGIKDFEVKD